jgi:hypothetical protein
MSNEFVSIPVNFHRGSGEQHKYNTLTKLPKLWNNTKLPRWKLQLSCCPGRFFILDRNIADVTFLIGPGNLKAIDALRSEAVEIFITDSQGKAEIKDLKPGIYHICGVGKTGTGIWSVRIEAEAGQKQPGIFGSAGALPAPWETDRERRVRQTRCPRFPRVYLRR